MNGSAAFLFAFGGGLVSFLSPCTLPLLPGYLSYISGLGADEIEASAHRAKLVGAAILFVLGFSLVFVSIGATASYIGAAVLPHRPILTKIAGVFIIAMALVMMGALRIPLLYQERRFHLPHEFGPWGAFPLGMAFAFGWSPCIGPVLGSIYVAAATEGSAQRGAVLLFIYALGLGLPFLLVALFAERIFSSLTWFKAHFQAINVSGGAILMAMGVFLFLGRWTEVLGPALRWYGGLHLPT